MLLDLLGLIVDAFSDSLGDIPDEDMDIPDLDPDVPEPLEVANAPVPTVDAADTVSSASSAVEPHFGEIQGRFDVPDAVSAEGNNVGSDASGALFDKQTGQSLSEY
jgi:hypothetical protein